jgi:hypothetical protein
VTHSLMMIVMCVLVSLFLISTGGSGHPQNHGKYSYEVISAVLHVYG